MAVDGMPVIKGMAQVAIASSDPAKLSAYYRDTLGLGVLFEASGMTFFGAGGLRLMIGPAEGARPGDKILYFEPEDFAVAETALEARGVSFSGKSNVLQRDGGKELALRAFKDPEGNQVALLGWRPVSPGPVRG